MLAHAADVSRAADCEGLVDAVVAQWGGVDILLNNAGTSAAAPFEKVDDETWQSDWDLKVMGAIRMSRLVIPHMKKRGGGRIVNITTVGGKTPLPRSLPTTVTRAAGLNLTKSLANEYAADNIRVNTICIGLVRSAQIARRAKGDLEAHYAELAKQRVPLGRVAHAAEFADLFAFLVSERATYITGHVDQLRRRHRHDGMKSRQVLLAARPAGAPRPSDFRLVDVDVPEPGPGEILVRNIYMSVDPYMRGRMNEKQTYAPAWQVGQPADGRAVGEVMKSRHRASPSGAVVVSNLGWREHFVSNGEGVLPIDRALASLSAFLGVLGVPGFTGWYGLKEIGRPKAAETLVVSGAAGATGSLVVQIGKILGCRVVATAGTDDKCAWLTKDLGADAAINYRKGDLAEGAARGLPARASTSTSRTWAGRSSTPCSASSIPSRASRSAG